MPFKSLLLAIFTSIYITFSCEAQTKKSPLNEKNISQQASSNLSTGLDHYKKSELDKAINHLNLAKQQATKEKDTVTLVKALNGIGKVYSDRGENPTALSFYQKALALAHKTNDELSLAHIEKNIGVLYIGWKHFDKALQHYEIAQQIALKIGNDKLVADCYNNKGTVYEQLEQYPKALAAYKKALSFYQKNNSLSGVAMSYSNMAIVHKQQKQYQQAINYNFKALEIMQQMGEKWMQAATLNNIGSVYYSMQDYSNTLVYCEQSLTIAKSINAKEIEVAAYETLADAAAALKQYSLAYTYMTKFHKVSQDYINIEKTHQFSELEIKYKTEKKEQKIALLNKQATIQQLTIDKRNQTIAIISGASLLLGVIGYQYFNRNKIKQEAQLNIALAVQQEKAASAVIEAEENERKRIAGDLHDGVGQLLSVVSMNLSVLGEKVKFEDTESNATYHQTVNLLKESYKEMRNISHQMMPDALIKHGLPDAVRFFVKEINPNILKTAFHAEGFKNRIDGNIEIMLYRVIQECVNNTIKHARATQIDIQLELLNNHISCTIEDDGKGFSVQDTSDGIGLNNIKSRIAYIKGKLEISSSVGMGTLISINVPV